MLKSDRIYFARYSVDPEMELDDLELYFDDENEEIAGDMAIDSPFEFQADESFLDDPEDLEERYK